MQQGLNDRLAEAEVDINDVAEKDDNDISFEISNMVAFVLDSIYFKGMQLFRCDYLSCSSLFYIL